MEKPSTEEPSLLVKSDYELVSRYLLNVEKQHENEKQNAAEKKKKQRRSLRLESWKKRRKFKDDSLDPDDNILQRCESTPPPASRTPLSPWLRWARRGSREWRGAAEGTSSPEVASTLQESWTDMRLVKDYWEAQSASKSATVNLPSNSHERMTLSDEATGQSGEREVPEDVGDGRESRRQKQRRMLMALSNLKGAKITRIGSTDQVTTQGSSDDKQLDHIAQKLENIR